MCIHTLRGLFCYSSPPCVSRQGPSLNLHYTIPARLAGYLAPMILSVSALSMLSFHMSKWGSKLQSSHLCSSLSYPLSPCPSPQKVFSDRLPWHLKEVCYAGKRLKQQTWVFLSSVCCTVDILVYS